MFFKESLGEWVIRNRWRIILITIMAVTIAGAGIRLLGFSTDYRVFFSEETPQLKAFEEVRNIYTKHENALIVLAPKNGKVFTRESLAVVDEVTQQSWQIPYSSRVDSITNFQHSHADEDELIVENLVEDAANATAEYIERVQNISLSEPLLLNRLINPKADVTAVNITFNLPDNSRVANTEVVEFIRNMADEIRASHPEMDIYMTGVVFMNNAFREASREDMKTLMPIMYLLIIGVMLLILRSFLATLSTLLVIIFSILTGMGMAGWMGISLLPISANAPTIIMTLAVADCIHILITLVHEMRQGKTKHDAIIESLRINHQPIFLTSLTTAIGFLALNFGDSPPLHDLGNIVAIGVLAAYVYSILFLPAVMSILPMRVTVPQESRNFFIDHLGDFVIRKQKPLFWGMLTLLVILGSQIGQIEINEKFNEYFDKRYSFRNDNDFVTSNLTGFYSIQYSLGAGESGGVNRPEYLATLEKFASWYRNQPGVLYVETLADTMKRLNKNMHGDEESFYRIGSSRELNAQYLLLYELSLPFGLDMNNQINIDKSSTRFTVILENVSTREVLDLEDRVQDWFRENAPAGMNAHGSSPLIMFSHIAERNLNAMMGGTLLAFLLISGAMSIALRSFKMGLISLIPNILPLVMTFGLWGILFREIGFAVAVVAPVALGIIVDDTVHFLSKYTRARREKGTSPEDAVCYSFHTVGTALGSTSLILTAGFFTLSYSGFTMSSHLGIMTTLAVLSAILIDFLFLPPLLLKLDQPK